MLSLLTVGSTSEFTTLDIHETFLFPIADMYLPYKKSLSYEHQDPYVAEDVLVEETSHSEGRRSQEYLRRSPTSSSFDMRSDPSPLSNYSTDYSVSGCPPFRELRAYSCSSDSNSCASVSGVLDPRERTLGSSASTQNSSESDRRAYVSHGTVLDPEGHAYEYSAQARPALSHSFPSDPALHRSSCYVSPGGSTLSGSALLSRSQNAWDAQHDPTNRLEAFPYDSSSNTDHSPPGLSGKPGILPPELVKTDGLSISATPNSRGYSTHPAPTAYPHSTHHHHHSHHSASRSRPHVYSLPSSRDAPLDYPHAISTVSAGQLYPPPRHTVASCPPLLNQSQPHRGGYPTDAPPSSYYGGAGSGAGGYSNNGYRPLSFPSAYKPQTSSNMHYSAPHRHVHHPASEAPRRYTSYAHPHPHPHAQSHYRDSHAGAGMHHAESPYNVPSYGVPHAARAAHAAHIYPQHVAHTAHSGHSLAPPHAPLHASIHGGPAGPMAYYDYGVEDSDSKQPPLLPGPIPAAKPYLNPHHHISSLPSAPIDAMNSIASTSAGSNGSSPVSGPAATSKRNRKGGSKDSSKKKDSYMEIVQEITTNNNDIKTVPASKLIELMRCHSGCKYLQTLLEEEEVAPGGPLNSHIFSVVVPLAIGLSINPYGNYIFQKMIPRLLPAQRHLLTQCLLERATMDDILSVVPDAQAPDAIVRTELLRPLYDGFREADAATQSLPSFLRSALDVHGTRSIQKLIQTVWSDSQCMDMIIQEFKHNNKSIVKLAQHPNGCHVLFVLLNMGFENTRILDNDQDEAVTPSTSVNLDNPQHVVTRAELERIEAFRQWVVSVITDHLIELACHKNGSGIVIRAFEVASSELRNIMIHRFVQSAIHISADPFGNFVASYILDSGSPKEVEMFFNALKGYLLDLSLKKFGSNVIERCLGVLKGRIGSGTSPHRKSRIITLPSVLRDESRDALENATDAPVQDAISDGQNSSGQAAEMPESQHNVTLYMDRKVVCHTVEELLGIHPVSQYVFDIHSDHYTPSPTGNVRCLEILLGSAYGNYVLQSVLPAAKAGGAKLVNILFNLINPFLATLTRTQIHVMFVTTLVEQYPNKPWKLPSWYAACNASATTKDSE